MSLTGRGLVVDIELAAALGFAHRTPKVGSRSSAPAIAEGTYRSPTALVLRRCPRADAPLFRIGRAKRVALKERPRISSCGGLHNRMLPAETRRDGLRPLVRFLIWTVARLTESGRRPKLPFARPDRRRDWLARVAGRLEPSWGERARRPGSGSGPKRSRKASPWRRKTSATSSAGRVTGPPAGRRRRLAGEAAGRAGWWRSRPCCRRVAGSGRWWPSSSWMVRTSTPDSSRCTANAWRSEA